MNAATSQQGTFRFALDGRTTLLTLPRREGLDFLDWLGLGRPEFGAVEARDLVPLCRRRLWPERRNELPFATSDKPCRIREARALRDIAEAMSRSARTHTGVARSLRLIDWTIAVRARSSW